MSVQRKGNRTAVLDADITGPSIPQIFGIHEHVGGEDVIIPAISKNGMKVMSVNLLTDNETDPVVWRGPMIAGAVKQFWTEVLWGDIDYMFIDMPPGTGDVPLTVFQSIPVNGIVIVTSPQELVGMIVEKAVKMANMMNIPVLGLVENMSYAVCPACGEKLHIFGESHIEDIAKKYKISSLAQLPIDSNLAKACDLGEIEQYQGTLLDEILENL
ncbi:MAG: Mrp/NBP35 family ATP-binding protein [Clostridiaceae bacterium]|nr:Mrp/NBP35 family ATP-binding protein [Clostridiaceae bacterium]